MNLESYARIDENAKIQGVALIPRISRNNNLYTKEELQRFDGVTVPLNWEHNGDKVIGEATFHYNSELETVYYEGTITDPSAAMLAKNKMLFTSIEATPSDVKKICNGTSDCFSMPFGLIPEGLALTETPGVPETSVEVLKESLDKTLKQLTEHTDADHEFVDKYGASEIIHKTIKPREEGMDIKDDSVDNIMQDQFHNMALGLESQIKYKAEALELFKKMAIDNPEPLIVDQIEMLENDMAFLTNQLVKLRKDSEFISVESLDSIVNKMREKYICDCCGELKEADNKKKA